MFEKLDPKERIMKDTKCKNCKKTFDEHYDYACTWEEYETNEDI